MKRIRCVVFDVGETLLDDTPEWGRWADWIGIPRHTFSAVLGAVTAQGLDNAETFNYFRPGFDIPHERQLREDAGLGEWIQDQDLYPDVRPTLKSLQEKGFWIGIAGNQLQAERLADDNTMEPTAPSERLVSKRNVKFAPHHSLIEAVRQGTLGQLPDASFLRGGGYKHRGPSFCRSFMMSLLITVFSESIVLLLQPAPYT